MNDLSIQFLYGTVPGRGILKLLLNSGADRMIVRFLRSRWSRPLIPWYARRHNVSLDRFQLRDYRIFRDFFARKRSLTCIDYLPEHLISPCDGWLTAYPIEEDSSFFFYDERFTSLMGIRRIPPEQVVQSSALLAGIADLSKNL